MKTKRIRRFTQVAITLSFMMILGVLNPVVAFAATAEPSTPATGTGTQKPTGAAASTYTYNEETGVWENDHYTWNATTHQEVPKQTYPTTYNASSDSCATQQWFYNAAKKQYQLVPVTVGCPPGLRPAPKPVTETTPNNSSGSAYPSDNQQTANTTGSNSTNGTNGSTNTNLNSSNRTDSSISNVIGSYSGSGGVDVNRNTTAGDALSGDAQSIANVLNMLQSSWNPDNGDIATFIANLDGNLFGDLYIDPGQLANDSINTSTQQNNANLTINNEENASIHNDIDVVAETGDVNLTENTTVGDGTSGNATAMANLVNLINTSIATNQSFLGVLNINGSLDGDILLPPELLDTLLASNSAPTSTVNTSNIENKELLAEFTTNQTIANNVNADATSGNVTLDQNTTAGDATSGNANTNLTLLNLTGRQIIGDNALLVFVNVHGKWVGMIMDAPSGSTSAALGGGITTNTTTNNLNATVDSDTNQTITNNVNVAAASGDVTGSRNTTMGDATSGNATADVNIANIMGSQLSLAKWFGILFINILGNWNGSFGVNTSAGDPVTPVARPGGGNGSGPQEVQVFRFVPSVTGTGNNRIEPVSTAVLGDTTSTTSTSSTITEASPQQSAVLADTDSNGSGPSVGTTGSSFGSFTAIGLLTAASLLGAERLLAFRDKRRNALA